LQSGDIIAVQSKWFRDGLNPSQFTQIQNSISTALELRPIIKQYIICIPHDISSIKFGRSKKGEAKKPIVNYEENDVEKFTNKIKKLFPSLTITWWFENKIELELQKIDNDGIFKFWFENELFTIDYLKTQFALQKKGWLHNRYVPELHGQGKINEEYQKICFSPEYREGYLKKYFEEIVLDINKCIKLIDDFQQTIDNSTFLSRRLSVIQRNLNLFVTGFKNTIFAIEEGNDHYSPQKIKEVLIWKTLMLLEKIKPSNNQKGVLPQLISSLDQIHKHDLENTFIHKWLDFNQGIRLILGEAGTGKTHGLANCVEQHLFKDSPALIIQAKGTPCGNWSEILSYTLKLNNWNEEELFNALNSLAIRKDLQIAQKKEEGEEPLDECTKTLICIDGLDEDFWNKKHWYSRLRECELYLAKHHRLRFIFSARRYFYDNTEVPDHGIFEEVYLSREGDIQVDEIAPKYFSKEHFNIEISNYSLIKGIDSLFALRLFCEEYRNQKINEHSNIKNATRDLLKAKIERMNNEFIESLAPKRISNIINPTQKALKTIANYFFNNLSIDKECLYFLLNTELEAILEKNEIYLLIEKLVDDGILLSYYENDESDFLNESKTIYNITYQSIIEHIISEQAFWDIRNGKTNRIPEILSKGMVRPLDYVFNPDNIIFNKPPNQQIIQNIVNSIFIDTGNLIGINNFLIEGFSKKEIFEMQMEALIVAPPELAEQFKENVNQMFFGGYEKMIKILKYLILPSSRSNYHFFGAEYLHQILISQPSCFERDKLWSGLDRYEMKDLSEEDSWRYNFNNLSTLFDESGIGIITLSEFEEHNELPLVYAWGLSTIDQKLRDKLRTALTGWAIKNPLEFKLLLDKIFNCNDPQIQEDLASIMLGVAGRIKEKEALLELANWSIQNIFSDTGKYRNIIIRQGFRSIAERAYLNGLISKLDLQKCRPKRKKKVDILSLDNAYLETPTEEHYPIVHDLAWYVINKAFEDFLDEKCKESVALLEAYQKKYQKGHFYSHTWGMASAIGYIRSLGFDRKSGNGITDASHGGKSVVFTYEEKYTWLAVHFLQGYLSDYIPLKHWSGKRLFIKDYSQVTDIPNPSEKVIDLDNIERRLSFNKEWIVKENLSSEFDTQTELEKEVANWVKSASNLDYYKWLFFDSNDFRRDNSEKKWVALDHHCGLHDSNEYVYSYFDAKACLIHKTDFNSLKVTCEKTPDQLNFISSLDNLHSTPKTSTYCNPSDIVWMPWIEEEGGDETFKDTVSKKRRILHMAVTKVVQNTIDGENYINLPSKLTRRLLNCSNFNNDELIDLNGDMIGFIFEKDKSSFHGNQQILLIDYHLFLSKIEEENLKLVWFVEHFKQRNPLSKSFPEDFRAQKCRKYLVWLEDPEFKEICFWDEQFSNTRDKDYHM
jgi:hypothetical protein